jgi:hypothetical protein
MRMERKRNGCRMEQKRQDGVYGDAYDWGHRGRSDPAPTARDRKDLVRSTPTPLHLGSFLRQSVLAPDMPASPIFLPHLMAPERVNPFDLPIQRILLDWETGLPPWMKLVSPSDDDSAFKRLSDEIIAFAELITPTSEERLVRQNIIDRLQLAIDKIWHGAKVVPIGSYAQDLYTSSR